MTNRETDKTRILRSLHPDAVKHRARRWRWIRAGLALLLTLMLAVWTVDVHQAALEATSDSGPTFMDGILVGILCGFSLCVFVALLAIAIFSDIAAHRRRQDSP